MGQIPFFSTFDNVELSISVKFAQITIAGNCIVIPFFVTTAAAFAPQLPSPILRIPHFSFSPHFPSMHSYSLILESQNPSTHITTAFSFATSLPSLSPSLVLFSFLFPDFISQVTMVEAYREHPAFLNC